MKSLKDQNEEKPKEKKHKAASTSAGLTESVDSVRLKCREMLAKALKPDSEDDDCKSKVYFTIDLLECNIYLSYIIFVRLYVCRRFGRSDFQGI